MGNPKRIAFLGTGLMGAPMVRRLLGAGFEVNVWNRSVDKARRLGPDGAVVAASPGEAVGAAEIVITMLSDGPAVGDVLFNQGAAEAMFKGTIVVDMSSTKPGEAQSHGQQLDDFGVRHVDAPVSGGTGGAAAGTLAIMAGGDEDVILELRDVFAAMGRVKRVGPLGCGQLAKLANQAIVAINIGAVAEALLLASAGGADPAGVREALTGGFADSTILQQHGRRMLERDFEPGGRIHTQIKDLKNVVEEAGKLGVAVPLSRAMLAMFQFVRDDLAGGELDHSAALLGLEAQSGAAVLGQGAGVAHEKSPPDPA